jgi:putative tricarboxylic transport membrane protein
MRRADVVAAGSVLALAAVALHQAGRLPLGTARNPGPGFVPWWIAAALGALALVLLAQALTAARPGSGGPGAGERAGPVVGLVAVLAAYVALLEPAGYPACTFGLVVYMLRVVTPHRWPVALGVAALAAVGSFLVFAVWLKVPLPPGPSLG